jgi:hypothetical protein
VVLKEEWKEDVKDTKRHKKNGHYLVQYYASIHLEGVMKQKKISVWLVAP